MKTKSLSQNDREFFALVAKATFTNPFSRRRLELDREITGDKTNRPWVGIRPEAIREVNRRIGLLEKNNPVAIQDFNKADQRLIESVFLFDEYHKSNEPFDRFIVQQAKAGNEPLKVPFAKEALGRLVARGINADQAKRYFSLFYQIRRAFYFIDGGLIGQSPSMKKLRESLWNNIFTYDIDQYQWYLWD
ncbi:MAG: sigma-54-dependent Fis family transcriptional regulator, partial [Planctomycetes bacterium]|nr:sigma-54-dependent Fis family transcriptional regulator [Planctomycetota bacterium]